MTNYRSVYVDNVVLLSPHSIWTVHSIFNHVINLSCSHVPYLISISHISQPLLPYGIHLMPYDFKQVQQSLKLGDQMNLSSQQLHHDMFTIYVDSYVFDSQLVQSQPLLNKNINLFIDYLKTLDVTNGFGNTLKESLLDQYHPIAQLFASEDKIMIIHHLIGRGIGLTPTGDDMLLGYCFAMSTIDTCIHQLIKPLMYQELTTAVSQHYLYCASEYRFHDLLKKLYDCLAQPQLTLQQLQRCIQTILSYGHTSGCDILTGIVVTFYHMKRRNILCHNV